MGAIDIFKSCCFSPAVLLYLLLLTITGVVAALAGSWYGVWATVESCLLLPFFGIGLLDFVIEEREMAEAFFEGEEYV